MSGKRRWYGLAGRGEVREEGQEAKWKKSGNPAHNSLVSMLRMVGFRAEEWPVPMAMSGEGLWQGRGRVTSEHA